MRQEDLFKNKVAKAAVFFERGAWYYRTKTINNDFTTTYGKLGGFSTAEEAKQHYREDLEKYELKIFQLKQKQNTQISFIGYLNYWFRQVFLPRVDSSIQVGFTYILYNILLPNVKNDILLIMITSDYLETLLDKCAQHSESAGVQTQKFLRIAFKEALRDGYIKHNPMITVKKYFAKIPQVQILKKEQIKILLEAASRNQTLYLEVLLALFCGLRKGEILGLQFSDFDEKAKTLSIHRQITRNYNLQFDEDDVYSITSRKSIKPPKTANSNRTLKEVPDIIFTELYRRKNLIEFWKEKYGERYDHQNDAFVIVTRLGKIKSENTLNKALDSLCERNGIPYITVHGLRHMFATILMEQGVSLLKISRLLGHQSIHTTFETYCGVMDGLTDIGEFVDEAFDPNNATLIQRERL